MDPQDPVSLAAVKGNLFKNCLPENAEGRTENANSARRHFSLQRRF